MSLRTPYCPLNIGRKLNVHNTFNVRLTHVQFLSCVFGLVQVLQIWFYRIDFYSMKYIFIISPFFHDIKIHFYSVKINLCSVRNIFVLYLFFHSSKMYFCYMNFQSVFHLYLQKSEFYFQYVN